MNKIAELTSSFNPLFPWLKSLQHLNKTIRSNRLEYKFMGHNVISNDDCQAVADVCMCTFVNFPIVFKYNSKNCL